MSTDAAAANLKLETATAKAEQQVSTATPTSGSANNAAGAQDSPRLPPVRAGSPTVALLEDDFDDEGRQKAKKQACAYCAEHEMGGDHCGLKGRAFFQKLKTPATR